MPLEKFPRSHAMYRMIKGVDAKFLLVHTADFDGIFERQTLEVPSFKE